MFTLNDVILAYETHVESYKINQNWIYISSDDELLEKYDKLSKKQKLHFNDCLETARQTVIPADDPEDLEFYYEQLEDIFRDFL